MIGCAPFLLLMIIATCASAFRITETDICECFIKAKVIGEIQNTDRKNDFVLVFDAGCKHPFPLGLKILVKKEGGGNNFNTTTDCQMIKKECNVSLMNFKYESDATYRINVLLASCCSHCPSLEFTVDTPYEPTTTFQPFSPLTIEDGDKTKTLAKAVGIGYISFVALIIVSSIILFMYRRNQQHIPAENGDQVMHSLLQQNSRRCTGGIFIASFPCLKPPVMDDLSQKVCELAEKFSSKNYSVKILQRTDLDLLNSINSYLDQCDDVILIFDDYLWNIWQGNLVANDTYNNPIRHMLKEISQINYNNNKALYCVNAMTEPPKIAEYSRKMGISVLFNLSKEDEISELVRLFPDIEV